MDKVLLVLWGASFRQGRQGTNDIGSRSAFQGQIEATASQMNFVRHQKVRNVEFDVHVNTYSTPFDLELKKVIGEPLKEAHFGTVPNIGMEKLFNQTLDQISPKLEPYDYVLFLRADLLLKEAFKEVFYLNPDKVIWPCLECYQWQGNETAPPVKDCYKYKGKPFVNDTFCVVPKLFFPVILEKKLSPTHYGWIKLAEVIGNKGQSLLLSTLHEADPMKDWNPLYFFANRERSQVWLSPNIIVTEALEVRRYDKGVWRTVDKLR
jgi:hypothetical protein